MAAARIVQNSVFDSVDGIAGGVHRVADHLQLGRGDVAGGIDERGLRDPQMAACVKMRPIVGGIARDNAVVVARIALRFRQGFQAALRTAAEIGMLGRGAIESLDDGLVRFRGHVDGAMREVDHALHVPLRPVPVIVGDVARIGAAGRVAAPQRVEHRRVIDGARQPAVAGRQQFLVPRCGHPEFEMDFRRDSAGHAAKCGNIDCGAGGGRSELPRRNGLRESNRHAGQAEGGQAFAGLLCERRDREADK